MRLRSIAVRLAVIQFVLGLVVVVAFMVTLNGITVRAAERIALRSDLTTAGRLAPWIERYYKEHGSFDGIRRWISSATGEREMAPITSMRNQMNRHDHMEPAMVPPGIAPLPLMVLTTDSEVAIQMNIPPDMGGKLDDLLWTPLRVDGDMVGRLAVGSMVMPRLGAVEQAFVRNIKRSASVAALVLLLGAGGLGIVWYRTLVVPITRVATAVQAFGSGHRSLELKETKRSDEIGDLAKAVDQMAEEVMGQEDARRRFVSDAAHELRTPVALLKSQIELLTEGVYSADADQFSRMSGYTHRLSRLVNDLQTLARMDAGRFHIETAPVDLKEVIRSTVDGFGKSVALTDSGLHSADRQIEIVTDLPESAPYVAADGARVHQVLENLVANALRYAPEHSAIVVSMGPNQASAHTGFLEVRVADQGPGIPRDQREQVFERFARLQTDRSRDSGGSGLGLAICRELVTRQGGTIWIEPTDSLTDRGTTVVFALPVTA